MRAKRSSSPGVGGRNAERRFVTLLVQANPVADGALNSAELSTALDRVGERITADGWRRSWTRPGRMAVAIAFVAAALVVTAVALGAMFGTHTGVFPKSAGTENDKTELLRTDASDFAPLVAKLVRDIPFPPGYRRGAYVARYVGEPVMQPQDGAYNTVQAAGIRGNIAYWAVCAWRGYWLKAHAQGDVANQTVGVAGLEQVASSDALKRTDSFWSEYLTLAQNEKHGAAAPPEDLANFDTVSCAGLEQAPGPTK